MEIGLSSVRADEEPWGFCSSAVGIDASQSPIIYAAELAVACPPAFLSYSAWPCRDETAKRFLAGTCAVKMLPLVFSSLIPADFTLTIR